jgi:LysR family hydrogen peroxide-inducible transcriptional activator
MRPTLRQLSYFIAVAEHGAFGPAAARLHVTQPSLSKQISKLEDELGLTLFERTTRTVRLTPAGHALLDQARRTLEAAREFKALAKSAAKAAGRSLKAGVLPSIGAYFMPRFLEALARTDPDIRVALIEGASGDLLERLAAAELDFVVASKGAPERFAVRPLFEETLWISGTPGDPLLASDAPLELDALAGRTLLALSPDFHLTQVIKSLAAVAGATVSTAYQGASLDAVRQMASSGAGVAVLPSLYALGEAIRDPKFRVRRIAHPGAAHPVLLYWRRSTPETSFYERMAQLMVAEKMKIRSERAEKFQV